MSIENAGGPQNVRENGAARPIGIALAVIGGVALAGSGATAALGAVGELSQVSTATSLSADGIRSLDLEVDASDVTVVFADVVRAELSVEGDRRGEWSLSRDGDELVVHSPDHGFGWWFGGWWAGEERVTLTLPQSLAGIDAEFELNAGSLDVAGDFGELDVVVGAGALYLEGAADQVDAEINAGRAEITLADVRSADLTISAGRLTAELTGRAPDEIVFDVSAGSMTLTVPDDVYDVTDQVDAGSFSNDVQTSSEASRTIRATVSAGSATLLPGD